MSTEKKHSIILPIFIFSLFSLIIGFFLGHASDKDRSPRNCAELGAAHLAIGREQLKNVDPNGERWKKMIDDETALTNLCYKSIEQK